MSVAQQAPLVEVTPHPPTDENGGAISPDTAARLKMRSRGRVRSLRQAIEVIDPVTMERVDAERDALLKKALLVQGVELQQLLPRMLEDFQHAHATPEIVQARFKGFERMRMELLDLVLETRRQLQSQAEGRRRAKAQQLAAQDSDATLGMESPEDMLQREQQHMQRVLHAAHQRIEKEKEMEQDHELMAQEMIRKTRVFNEGVVLQKKTHEKTIEKTRYKTELHRQARNTKREEDEEDHLAESRRLAEDRAQNMMNFEAQNAQNKNDATDKALKFARERAVKLERIKKLNAQKEAKLLATADRTEQKMEMSEKMRTQTMEIKMTTIALQNEDKRLKAAKILADKVEQSALEREDKKLKLEEKWEEAVGRGARIQEEKAGSLRRKQLASIAAEEEAEKRRTEAAQSRLEGKMRAIEERAAQKQARSQEQYEKSVQETRLKNELGKLQFATKRVMVERLEKKEEYEREIRQQEIDRKDAQTRSLKEAKIDIRERRARQSRNFFVQQRQMADVQEKELQYFRFFGRPTGSQPFGRPTKKSEVEQQMLATGRLLEGESATRPDGDDDDDEDDEEEPDDYTKLSAYHKSLMETGREWLLNSSMNSSSPRLPPVSPR